MLLSLRFNSMHTYLTTIQSNRSIGNWPTISHIYSWKPVSSCVHDQWLESYSHYPKKNESLSKKKKAEAEKACQDIAGTSAFDGSWLRLSLSKNLCNTEWEGVKKTDEIRGKVFPLLSQDKTKTNHAELGMVYVPHSLGHLSAKHVRTKHDVDEVKRFKAYHYGILAPTSYPNLESYPKAIKDLSTFEGHDGVGLFDHYPNSLYDCCKYMTTHGVPAATSEFKVSCKNFMHYVLYILSYSHSHLYVLYTRHV